MSLSSEALTLCWLSRMLIIRNFADFLECWSSGTVCSTPFHFPPTVTLLKPSSSSLPLATLYIDSLDLDCPPLSSGTLHLLTTCSSSSPPFEPSPLRDLSHALPFVLPSMAGFISTSGIILYGPDPSSEELFSQENLAATGPLSNSPRARTKVSP